MCQYIHNYSRKVGKSSSSLNVEYDILIGCIGVERAHIARSNLLAKCKDTVCKVSELRNGVNTVSQASFSQTNVLYLHFYCGFLSVNSLNCNFCHPRVPYLFSRAFSRISGNGQYSAAVTLLSLNQRCFLLLRCCGPFRGSGG
jgi:hypothetical protein